MQDKAENSTFNPTMDNNEWVQDLEDEWSEYRTKSGRTIYYNKETKKKTYKPPRKTKVALTHSLSKTEINNKDCHNKTNQCAVGIILKEGPLRIAKIWDQEKSIKKKWKKCKAVLTDSHFLYRKEKKLDGYAGSMPLLAAKIRREESLTKRKNAYVLDTTRACILLLSKEMVESEAWYHAIDTVINTLESNNKKILTKGQSFRRSIASFHVQVEKEPGDELFADETRGSSRIKSILKYGRSASVDQLDFYSGNRRKELGFKFPVPPVWTVKFDVKNRRYLYEHAQTGDIWGAAMKDDGGIYFYDTKSERRSLLLPYYDRRKETDV